MVSFTSLATAALALVASVSAAPAPVSSGAKCPFNYPTSINTTTASDGLTFTVISNNPKINNHLVVLRPNPNLKGGYFGGVDATSRVLLANFNASGLYAQARNNVNQLYNLGPTAYLNLHDSTNGTKRYSFAFANATTYPGKVEKQFYLLGGPSDGVYGLYHNEGNGVSNGFMICPSDIYGDSGWYQLFYYVYAQTPANYPGCEFIGLRTTVAPTIINGQCNIGGYTANAL